VIRRLRARLAARRQWWESLCRQCGACCYRKEWRGAALVVNWDAPCQFLDTANRRCTVYEQRFRVCSDCRRMTLAHAMFTTWLPDTCGYVRAFRPWRGATVRDPRPHRSAPDAERARL
jgi:uncharacterized cysteine cluster protein YcgN (CxxCxxCC family)